MTIVKFNKNMKGFYYDRDNFNIRIQGNLPKNH